MCTTTKLSLIIGGVLIVLALIARGPTVEALSNKVEIIEKEVIVDQFEIIIEGENGEIISSSFGGGVDNTMIQTSDGVTILISSANDKEKEELP